MIQLTITAAEKLRLQYATLDELASAMGISETTAGHVRERRAISRQTAQKAADLLGQPLHEVVSVLTPDEQRIIMLQDRVLVLTKEIADMQDSNSKFGTLAE